MFATNPSIAVNQFIARVAAYMRHHPSQTLLILVVLHWIAPTVFDFVEVVAASKGWYLVMWYSYNFRMLVQHFIMTTLAWHATTLVFQPLDILKGAAKAVFFELLCCRRRTRAERLFAALVRDGCAKALHWQDHSVWVADPAYRFALPAAAIQVDDTGEAWACSMSASRGSEVMFDYEATPPPSKKPTPSFDVEADRAGASAHPHRE